MTTHILILEPILRCPRCAKSYHESDVNYGITFPRCQKCEARWWAMLLRKGLVFPQLAKEFDDEDLAARLIVTYRMPLELVRRTFWQIPLRPRDVHTHRESTPRELFGALALLPR